MDRIGAAQISAFFDAGILDLRDIPAEPPPHLNDQQHTVLECVRTGKPKVGAGLKAALEVLRWPAYYLDFETVKTAIPLYADIKPHAQVVTQYSIHRCRSLGQEDAHFEYLADPKRDCQRELAERLIADLGDAGDIIVYHSFEHTQIRELTRRFPDLAQPLSAIDTRLFDLLRVVRAHYYHPAFHTS
jgi:hypothetical protein